MRGQMVHVTAGCFNKLTSRGRIYLSVFLHAAAHFAREIPLDLVLAFEGLQRPCVASTECGLSLNPLWNFAQCISQHPSFLTADAIFSAVRILQSKICRLRDWC